MATGEERRGSMMHYGKKRAIALGGCVALALAGASLAYADSSAPPGRTRRQPPILSSAPTASRSCGRATISPSPR